MTVPVRKAGPYKRVRLFRWKKIALADGPGRFAPKIAFTGLGNLSTLRQRPRVDANALTWF